jgi:hypothetical protein
MLAALVLSLATAQLQPDRLTQINREINLANRDAMWVLNGWAAANLAVGLGGWISAEDPEWRAFHQANFVWNLVNLGLGVNGVIQTYADPSKLDLEASRKASQSTQISYLVNGGLDFVYLAVGAILLWRGNACDSPLLRGWGKAVMLQAVFLILFDLALFGMNSTLGAPLRAGTNSVL